MKRQYRVPSTEYRVHSPSSPVLGTRYSVPGTRYPVLLAALLLLPTLVGAQTQLADSLWLAGRYHEAGGEYLAVLHENPGSVRALYRLAILGAWGGKLDSALALLRDAREIEPRDPDVRLWEARVLQWRDRYPEALARYDSLIAEDPGRQEARVWRAETLSWLGRQNEADREYRALIAEYPENAEALFKLAQLMLWQQRLAEADDYNTRALRVAPDDPAGRDLARQIRALLRPRLEVTLGMSHDSDDNNAWWQTVGTSFVAAAGLRAFGSVGAYEASDRFRDGTRIHAEAGANLHRSNWSLTGALGARKLNSRLGPDRALGTWRLGASYRIRPGLNAGLGYARYSFDETAQLLAGGLDVDELSVEGDLELRQNLSVGVGTGIGLLSDGNRRKSLVVAVPWRVLPRVVVSLYGRGLFYNFKGAGYFSPDHFLVWEGRVAVSQIIRPFVASLSGGVGLQDVALGGGSTSDGKWHVEASVARRWGVMNEIALAGGYSTSAVSSASGAFDYLTATLTAKVGL